MIFSTIVNFFRVKNKKGISPLIATVLLIAFAVALGAVVMNWGRAYVEDTARETGVTSDTRIACSQNVNVQLVHVGGSPRICYNDDDKQVEITIQNRGSVNLEGFVFNILGTEGSGENHDYNTSLSRSGIERFELPYDSSEHGQVEFVQVVPKIMVSGSNVPAQCSDYGEQWEEVLRCK
ncbi:MAG: archaellin/type IV pilin N-terminal domain-containing protein [Candidatus Woesearchaeota archaeon]